MDFDNQQQHEQEEEEEQQQQQRSSGLLRFRSAPSSLFANPCDNLDSDRFYSRLLNSHENDAVSLSDFEEKSMVSSTGGVAVLVNTAGTERNYENKYPLLPLQYSRQTETTSTSPSPVGVDDGCSIAAFNSLGTSTNLVRQNSSPAGFFSQLNPQNGYASTRGVGNSREVDTFRSRLGLLPQISEIGNESTYEPNSPDDVKFVDGQLYGSGFQVSSWISNDASDFVENDEKLFCGSQKNGVRVLSHHLSLPKGAFDMKKLRQMQDSVPCRTRAKRGCATHPRSIAERVRRTRISERMRKLQELVPNMDKQTNTAVMLDLAVDYIKDLQKQFKALSDTKAKCKCSNKQR